MNGTGRNRAKPVAVGKSLMGGLLAVALGWQMAAWAAEGNAAPNPQQVLAQAETRMENLKGLLGSIRRAESSAESLRRAAQGLAGNWQSARQADEDAESALGVASSCLPEVRQALTQCDQALTVRAQAMEASRQAVRQLALAPQDQLQRFTALSEDACKRGIAAEKALLDRQRTLGDQSSGCARKVDAANAAVRRAVERTGVFTQQASSLSQSLETLHADWSAANEAMHAAAAAWAIPVPALGDPASTGSKIARLRGSLPLLRGAPAITKLDLLWTIRRTALERIELASELTRLEDAAAYLELARDSRLSGCARRQCQAFDAERRALEPRLQASRQALSRAGIALDQAAAGLDVPLSDMDRAARANHETLARIEPYLDPARTEAAEAGARFLETATAAENAVRKSLEDARRAWASAFAAVHGRPPVGGGEMARPAPPPPPEERTLAATTMASPELRVHAHAVFGQWDGEPRGFGAYTYVLLRGEQDLKSPAVRQRLHALVAALSNLPRASLVLGEQKPHANLFCIPAKNANDPAAEPVYDSDLGQQLKLRAQYGLFARKEIAKRLTSAPGPFLITFPGRIAEVRTGAPVLFADLSAYPAGTIADLASSFMNGLVDDFPARQELWRPPIAQRVALEMIRLASDGGRIVAELFPSAHAQPH